jgi:hypothetical protein
MYLSFQYLTSPTAKSESGDAGDANFLQSLRAVVRLLEGEKKGKMVVAGIEFAIWEGEQVCCSSINHDAGAPQLHFAASERGSDGIWGKGGVNSAKENSIIFLSQR